MSLEGGRFDIVDLSFIKLVNRRLVHNFVLRLRIFFCCRSYLLVTILLLICDLYLIKKSSMKLTLLIDTAI
jgi:hypothetical protein